MAMENGTTNGNESISYSKEEIEQIQKDIDSAKSSLVSDETKKEIQQAKEEARKEAEKEMLIKQEITDKEKLIEDLKRQKIEQEKEFNDKFKSMEDKLNDMVSSKAPVSNTNPFTSNQPLPQDTGMTAKNMSDDQINDIERESGVAFLGDEFIRPI